MAFSDREINLILAAGRTGTAFLTRALGARFPSVRCVHEPSPSRIVLVGGNFRNRTGVGTRFVRALFRASLTRRLASLGPAQHYVEVNPMLCPVTDLVGELDATLNVVHLVREPRSWVQSIRAFKASRRFRNVIDFVPLATPFPTPRPGGWSQLSQTERALWRWRFCNDQILALESACTRYTRVRYEDLFTMDAGLRRSSLDQVLACLGLDQLPTEGDEDADWFAIETVINPAPTPIADDAMQNRDELDEIDSKKLDAICGPLLAQFGYA